MQIFHQSTADDKKVKQAAISIMFSVEEYDKTIDEVNNKTLQDFFRQFQFEVHEDKVSPEFWIGDALNTINYLSRWVYTGAITEPPCPEEVYWNIVRTIYPIELERYQWYKDFIYSKKEYLGTYKNNRKIQQVHKDDHLVSYIGAYFFQKSQIAFLACATLLGYSMS